MEAFAQMRKEMKALRKITKRKLEKRDKKRKSYDSSDNSSDSDSEQDDGRYEHGIMLSEISNKLIGTFSTENTNAISNSNFNNNITPIKFVDKPLYKHLMKVVKGVGTCSTVAAVPQLIKDGKQPPKESGASSQIVDSMVIYYLFTRLTKNVYPKKRDLLLKNGKPLMELLRQQKLVNWK